jgi:DNA phosphorothioation-associated putative methyltransferase
MNASAKVGKQVVDDLYLHVAAIDHRLESAQAAQVRALLSQVTDLDGRHWTPNVVKLNLRDGRTSLLCYPDFDTAPFPQLAASWTQQPGKEPRCRFYDQSLNPPILHRKELLVPAGWPDREVWGHTTALAESLGLFDDSHTIGLRGNWERLLAAKGYCVRGGALMPVGNDESLEPFASPTANGDGENIVHRHLTALSRATLSAPMQLVLRLGLLSAGMTVFDYGCGKGDDVRGLASIGFTVAGWDPYYASDQRVSSADVVNLGFVINVIEDPLERAEALRQAATLAGKLLVVSVMLLNSALSGIPFNDGVLSSRRTFQKYFSQEELREYLEHALGLPAVMVGPGIALLFKERELEQQFLISRYRRKNVADRLITSVALQRPPRPQKVRVKRERRPTLAQAKREELRPILSDLWQLALDLGRWPVADEIPNLSTVLEKSGSLSRALRLVQGTNELQLLEDAGRCRKDDVLLYLAMQQFSRRPAYKRLDERLQRDIKTFFGAYGAAYSAASALLRETGDPERIRAACESAASLGLGCLDDNHSLQLHICMVNQLPAVLRAYIGCGLVLWDETSAVQLVKVHIRSGKLTLLEFEDFDGCLLPRLARRIKINLPRLDYQIFEYGNHAIPRPLLYAKSRYINEEYPGYEQQLAFDEALRATGLLEGAGEYGPSEAQLVSLLERLRLRVGVTKLERSELVPDLDQECGNNFTYRSFVECGETQQRLRLYNVPLRPETYNALHDLATHVLDPLIDYFGGIRLTYGFSSAALAGKIERRIAPKLDQHSCCEVTRSGSRICMRGGAACDFLVEDESMRGVAEWIISNVPFDRLYYYGDHLPLHVSYGSDNSREAYEMRVTSSGILVPRRYKSMSPTAQ